MLHSKMQAKQLFLCCLSSQSYSGPVTVVQNKQQKHYMATRGWVGPCIFSFKKTKLLIFVNHWSSAIVGASEIKNGRVGVIFCFAFWPLFNWQYWFVNFEQSVQIGYF